MKAKLYNILNELSNYHRTKTELRQLYISERLSKSLVEYYKTLSQSVSFLSDQKVISVMKEISK